jgi:hypothetical protein
VFLSAATVRRRDQVARDIVRRASRRSVAIALGAVFWGSAGAAIGGVRARHRNASTVLAASSVAVRTPPR